MITISRFFHRPNSKTDSNKKSSYYVENCGKEDFGNISQLNASIETFNHKHIVDKDILIRLVSAWNKMKNDSSGIPKEYQVGGQWLPILVESFAPLMNALDNNDLDSLEKLLKNLFRKFGDFFGEPTNYHSDEYKHNKLERFKIYSSRWLELYGEKSIEEIIDPLIGNPVGFLIDGKLFTQGNFINNHFARRIEDLTSGINGPVVCEIGGGFGGVAYHLIKRCPNANYIDYDIPLIALVSAYYLLTAYPKAKIGLYGEVKNLENPFDEYNVVILPNYAIRLLKNKIADVCLNKCSFAEMDKSTVVEYMKQFERICRGYILHMNHSWEPSSKNAFYQPTGGFKHWNLSEIEPNKEKFRRIYKIPAPFQSDFHGEFFEWLYQKKEL